MDRLNEIRARCEAATAGPWGITGGQSHIVYAKNDTVIGECWCPKHEQNASFIAHARDDIPYLLAELTLSKAREHPVNLFPELTPQQRAENAEIVALTARAEKAEAELDTYRAALQNWHEGEENA